MAELESDVPSSVTHLPDPETSSSNGSGISEVNKGPLSDEDHQTEKNNIMPSSNVSNNFKTNNGFPLLNVSTFENSGYSHESSEMEVQENMKNELMSQQHLVTQQHSSTSDTEKGVTVSNERSVLCKDGKKGKNVDKDSKGEKKRRGIRFPENSCTTDCLAPPDPWKDAPLWTTDELITAYKKSCDINGSKPVVKILQQLHGISAPGKRMESFVLKGEKLDQKQVECIEEVFRRVQFHLVDLEATHLDDECAVALFDMIEHYESACQLNVSFNRNISARGWQACSRLVRRTPTLTFLDIRNCDLNERTIPIFGRALKMGCHLTVLHMEGMSLTSRPLIILVAALKMNSTLQELFLAENKFVPTDGVQLGNLLRYNHKLNLVDLRNNNLQDVGVVHLCDGLVEQKSGHGLRTLVLWNNQISYQAMQALGQALAACSSLETLNIGHNGITNEGVHLFKDGLLKTTSLLRLGLQGTKISDEGAVALAEYIADSSILLRIDLRDNDIKTGGLMALSHAMRVNSSVTRIDLDKETKKESGMKDYAEVQIRLLRDILTFQERNVQLVVEREEAERARLEKLAEEAAAVREKVENESEEKCPLAAATSNTESFTIVEAENVEESEGAPSGCEHEKDENFSVENGAEILTSLPSVTFSEEEEQMPTHQRPSVLFARMGLQPQESLDSPHTPTDQRDVFHSPPEPSSPKTPPRHPSLPLDIPEKGCLSESTPTAEMLLSPQYYPKRLAKKIFSVSRVSENSTSPLASPTADDMCEYDPLNVSLVSLVPEVDCLPSFESAASPLAPASSQPPDVAVSPTTLFQDLADDQDLSVLPSNDCLSSSAPSDSQSTSELKLGVELVDNCDKEKREDSDSVQYQDSAELSSTPEKEKSKFEDCIDNPDYKTVFENTHDAEDHSNVDEQAFSLLEETDDNTEKVCDDLFTSDVSIQDTTGGAMTNTLESLESQAVSEPDSQSNVQSNDNTNEINSLLSQDFSLLCNDPSDDENRSSSMEATEESSHLSHDNSQTSHLSDENNQSSNSHSGDSLDNTAPSSENPEIDVLSQEISSDTRFNVDCTKEMSVDKKDQIAAGAELGLEEEPWTAVESEDSSTGAMPSTDEGDQNEKQPDFFTTLSLNGLTQELASALTSLDGSSAQDSDGAKDLPDQDDFERELNAMVAEVQNNPLKN